MQAAPPVYRVGFRTKRGIAFLSGDLKPKGVDADLLRICLRQLRWTYGLRHSSSAPESRSFRPHSTNSIA